MACVWFISGFVLIGLSLWFRGCGFASSEPMARWLADWPANVLSTAFALVFLYRVDQFFMALRDGPGNGPGKIGRRPHR